MGEGRGRGGGDIGRQGGRDAEGDAGADDGGDPPPTRAAAAVAAAVRDAYLDDPCAARACADGGSTDAIDDGDYLGWRGERRWSSPQPTPLPRWLDMDISLVSLGVAATLRLERLGIRADVPV